MAALGTVVTDLYGGRLADQPLDVEHILHGVGVGQMVIGAPGQSNRQIDWQGSCIEKVRISHVLWRRIGIVRIVRCPPSQPPVQVEDGILALLRIKEAETGADRPLIRGAPGDSQSWREAFVIRRDQPVAQASVSGELESRGSRS